MGRIQTAFRYVEIVLVDCELTYMPPVRDTLGTALYFAEYDVFRYVLGRDPLTDRQGPVPEWAKGLLPVSLIPFSAGAVAGVTSWALIYPVDVSCLHAAS